MKKRNNLFSTLMLVPPMVLLAVVWSPVSIADDMDSDARTATFSRGLAVLEGDQDESVTKAEDIPEDLSIEAKQKTIEEAGDEVVKNIEGALPAEGVDTETLLTEAEASQAEVVLETTEEEEPTEEVAAEESKIENIKKAKKKEEVKDAVACKNKEEEETLTEEVAQQEKDIMQEMKDFFQAVMVPMLANYVSQQSFRAPPVQTGFAGIPAKNMNFGAGIGLNLLSLSDYYNARSMGFGNTTINNYNVGGNFYNGPSSNGSMGTGQFTPQYNPMMSNQMFNAATSSPHSFNFGGLAVKDHSRFDQMNAQNTQARITPMVQTSQLQTLVARPADIPVQKTTNTRTAANTVSE